VIYECISPIMLGFGFIELLLQISIIRAKFMGEKYDLESSQLKIQGTFRGPNEDQNALFKKPQDRSGPSPPRPVVGGARSCMAGCTAVRLVVLHSFSSSSCLFAFLPFFLLLVAIMCL